MADRFTLQIVPELVVADLPGARSMLEELFGFVSEAADRLRRENQVIRLRHDPGFAFAGHGPIDHLALRAADTDAAAEWARARGAEADHDRTPGGPVDIPEFWTGGVRYAFFRGPSHAPVEFCARRDAPPSTGAPLRGHDHIGVRCTDLAASRGFFLGLGLGLTEAFATTLARADGETQVSFLSRDGFTVELYRPPPAGGPALSAAGPWRRLRFEVPGGPVAAEARTGPDGIAVEIAAAG